MLKQKHNKIKFFAIVDTIMTSHIVHDELNADREYNNELSYNVLEEEREL